MSEPGVIAVKAPVPSSFRKVSREGYLVGAGVPGPSVWLLNPIFDTLLDGLPSTKNRKFLLPMPLIHI